MKKIILSTSIILAAAAVAIGATSAYFSDTETSAGNTFTAGKLDLLVNVDGNEYNPLDGRPLFTASDVKPGDAGEETVNLRVEDNPACAFVDIAITDDNENTCVEPELEAEPGCLNDQLGELNDNLIFKVWNDEGDIAGWNGKEEDETEGDNILNGAYEKVLTEGTLTDGESYAIGELAASTDYYYGVEWSLPASVGNDTQTDSFTGSVTFNAIQKRNAYPNGCPIGENID